MVAAEKNFGVALAAILSFDIMLHVFGIHYDHGFSGWRSILPFVFPLVLSPGVSLIVTFGVVRAVEVVRANRFVAIMLGGFSICSIFTLNRIAIDHAWVTAAPGAGITMIDAHDLRNTCDSDRERCLRVASAMWTIRNGLPPTWVPVGPWGVLILFAAGGAFGAHSHKELHSRAQVD